jgi:phosphohistidine swiveling domain-containing protein
MKVHLIFNRANIRQMAVYEAVRCGMRALGWQNVSAAAAELIIVWGASRPEEKRSVTTLVMDFPYWMRKTKKHMREGFYKISLNGIHPTKNLDAGMGERGRYAATGGQQIMPWRKGGEYILIAGMGPKGSAMYGYRHGEWDAAAIETVRQCSGLPIVYRAKPSDRYPPKMNGVIIDNVENPISSHFKKAAAIVTHHGNTAVEGLQHGIPVFCHDGPASLLANKDLTRIEKPVYYEGREDFFEKLAYWQWSFDEIMRGVPLRHLQKKGLI